MKNFRQFALAATMLMCTLLAVSSPCGAEGAFNQFIGLGDSTLDSGFFRYTSTGNAAIDALVASAIANGAAGGFAGPGVMTSTIMAGRFGLPAAPVSAGGTNFANGSAFSALLSASAGGSAAAGLLPANVATTQQIANYLAGVGGLANPDALYVISTGNNDVTFVQNQGAAWMAANPGYLAGVASEMAASVATLQAAGARTIVVPNFFSSTVLAGPGGVIPSSNFDLFLMNETYEALKWSTLSAAGVRFVPADRDSLFHFVALHPGLFGLTPSSVLAANAPSSVSALVTSWDDITPLELQTYLFVDGKHLTTAGQQIESDYETSLLTGPTQMSLLAEMPVQGGLARAATIQGQIDLSGQHRGPNGVNVWLGGGVSSLTLKNYSGQSDISGTPFSGSAGVDYQLPFGLIVGAAFTAGTQTQDFSIGSGHFDQNDQAISLYSAYQAGPVWGDVVASYGWLQDTIARDVTIGLYTDSNSARTTGTSLALALRAGGDIHLGPVTTGPVAGLVLQRVRIDGFDEQGTSGILTGGNGVTALSYGEQLRDSAVSQLGWRASVQLGDWRPFVEAKWNHELVDQDDRMVKAAITTATAAPYSMAAAPVQSDWASGTVGTSYKLSEQVLLRASASATAFDSQTVSYGGEFGVNVSF